MRRYLAILCLSLPLFATTAGAALGAEGAWIKDDKGCEHWNEAPKAGETVTWTGDCKDGKAEGPGERKWSLDGKLLQHDKKVPLDEGKVGDGLWEYLIYGADGKVEESYSGGVLDGKEDGQGVLFVAKDGTYTGQFEGGEFSGLGRYVWSDGSTYRGQWQEGKLHGNGILVEADGSVYAGEFEEGDKHGEGQYVIAKNGAYVGTFVKGAGTGDGKRFYVNGDIYVGEHKIGKRDGTGVYYYASGNTYEGAFVADKKEGAAKHTWADGVVFEGEYKDDRKWNGTETHPDGREFKIKDGIYVHSGKPAG